jgi:hypothetical protein
MAIDIGIYAATYGAYDTTGGGGTTPTQLSAPANLRQTGSTTTSNTLAWGAIAGATGYRLRDKTTGATYTTTSLGYTENGLTAASPYSYDVQALGNGTTTSNSAYSAAITATTASAGNTSLTPDYAGWAGNTQADGGSNGGAVEYRGALSRRILETDHTAGDALLDSLLPNTDAAAVRSIAFIPVGGGTPVLVTSPGASNNYQRIPFTLPGTGLRQFMVVEGPAESLYNDTVVVGTYLRDLQNLTGGSTARFLPWPISAQPIFFATDSIGAGLAPTYPQTDAWELLVEKSLNRRALFNGHGGRSWGKHLSTDAQQNALLDLFAASGSNDLYLAVLVNDYFQYNGGKSSAQVRAIIASFLTKCKTRFPNANVFLETLKPTSNTFGANETVAAWNAAASGAATDAGGRVTIIDGSQCYSAAKTVDGTHPGTEAMDTYAAYVGPIIAAGYLVNGDNTGLPGINPGTTKYNFRQKENANYSNSNGTTTCSVNGMQAVLLDFKMPGDGAIYIRKNDYEVPNGSIIGLSFLSQATDSAQWVAGIIPSTHYFTRGADGGDLGMEVGAGNFWVIRRTGSRIDCEYVQNGQQTFYGNFINNCPAGDLRLVANMNAGGIIYDFEAIGVVPA